MRAIVIVLCALLATGCHRILGIEEVGGEPGTGGDGGTGVGPDHLRLTAGGIATVGPRPTSATLQLHDETFATMAAVCRGRLCARGRVEP